MLVAIHFAERLYEVGKVSIERVGFALFDLTPVGSTTYRVVTSYHSLKPDGFHEMLNR